MDWKMTRRINPNPNNQKTTVESSPDDNFSFLNLIGNSNGLALVTVLLLSATILILAIYIVRGLGTETTILGSYETNTKSLYVAEGGLEKVKSDIRGRQLEAFSFTGYSMGNSQEYIVNDAIYPMTTITNPVNYVREGTGWFITRNPATLALSDPLTSANAAWPVYKSVPVGVDFALVALHRPKWFRSSPTKILIPMVSESNNVQNPSLLNKSVAGTLELEYLNNLLAFQTFRDPVNNVGFLDNLANDSVVIGINPNEDHHTGTGYDSGINPGSTFITGIATFPNRNGRILTIKKCSTGNIGSFGSCDSDPYIIPAINSNTNTFIAGRVTIPSTRYYGKFLDAGRTFCEDYSSSNQSRFSVVNGQRYKLDYVLSSSLPGGCEND